MRAVAINAFGETPAVRQVAEPGQLAPDEILVRVHAAGVNPVDLLIARGLFTPFPITFPHILGLDFAGVVEGRGDGVITCRAGDRVYGRAMGTYADYVAVSEEGTISRIPENIDFAQAAALPSAAMTALTSVEAAGIGEASRVLIVGAAGGVGSFAVQFANERGAWVIATARDEDVDYLRKLGAAASVDYTRDDAMFPNAIDVLLDFASDAPGLTAMSKLVRDGGAVVSTRYVADVENLAKRNVKAFNVANRPTAHLLRRITTAVESGKLELPAIRIYPLEEAAAALAEFDRGHVRGKLVLVIVPRD
ncbi:MAG: NADP-dependent oxidoreductase [Thermoanaerobaculia bacterium]